MTSSRVCARVCAHTESYRAPGWIRLGALLLMLSLFPTACMTSKSPKSIPQAHSARGVLSTLVLRDGREQTGELIVVNDSGYVLFAHDRIWIARFGDVSRVILPVGGAGTVNLGPKPTAKMLDRARLLSRFPYGISPTLMTTLLTASKQETPDDLARPTP